MKNGKWKQFGKLTEKCYLNMARSVEDLKCWDDAFALLLEIVADGRSKDPQYAAELYQLDEMTDYEYDVQGWLEDYLDEVDMREDKEKVLKICDTLLDLFHWEEEVPSDLQMMKSMALSALGRNDEAVELCRHWLEEDPEDITAVTASIYAYTASRDLEAAEKLIREHIQEDTQCTEENDILFTAAAAFYKASGNKKEYKRIDDALEAYDEELEKFFTGMDGDEDGDDLFDWDDDDLPFN